MEVVCEGAETEFGRGRARPDRLPVRARVGVRPGDEHRGCPQADGRRGGVKSAKALSASTIRAGSGSRRSRPARPRASAAPSRAGFSPCRWWRSCDLPSSGRICRTEGSNSAARRTSQSGSSRVGAPARAAPDARFQRQRDLAEAHEVAGDRQETLALGARVGHGAQMQVGHVAHVDHAERMRGSPGIAPSIMRWMNAIEVEMSGPSTGPNTPTGLTTDEFEPALLGATKSQAARSASVFDLT